MALILGLAVFLVVFVVSVRVDDGKRARVIVASTLAIGILALCAWICHSHDAELKRNKVGAVEIESEWTARRREDRSAPKGRALIPTLAAKNAAKVGHPAPGEATVVRQECRVPHLRAVFSGVKVGSNAVHLGRILVLLFDI